MYYLLFLFLGLSLALVLIFALEYQKRKANSICLEKLAEKINGTVKYGWSGAKLEGSLEAEPLIINSLPSRNIFPFTPAPPRLSIGLPHDTLGEFYAFHKSSVEHSAMSAINFPPAETGNALFDKEFAIHSPYRSFIQDNFKDGEKRQAMRRLFTLGAKWIHFDGKFITAVWEPYKTGECLDGDFLHETLSRLRLLTKNLQQARPGAQEEKSDLFPILTALLAIFLATVVLSLLLVYNV